MTEHPQATQIADTSSKQTQPRTKQAEPSQSRTDKYTEQLKLTENRTRLYQSASRARIAIMSGSLMHRLCRSLRSTFLPYAPRVGGCALTPCCAAVVPDLSARVQTVHNTHRGRSPQQLKKGSPESSYDLRTQPRSMSNQTMNHRS